MIIGRGLHLNIDEKDNSLNFDLGLSVADYFRMDHKKAIANVEIIKKVCRKWKVIAKKYKIPSSEIDLMAAAFELNE